LILCLPCSLTISIFVSLRMPKNKASRRGHFWRYVNGWLCWYKKLYIKTSDMGMCGHSNEHLL